MGVSSLKYGEIELGFGETENPPRTPMKQARASAKAEQITETAEYQEQSDSVQAMLDTLHIEDPAAYETALVREELGEEKNH